MGQVNSDDCEQNYCVTMSLLSPCTLGVLQHRSCICVALLKFKRTRTKTSPLLRVFMTMTNMWTMDIDGLKFCFNFCYQTQTQSGRTRRDPVSLPKTSHWATHCIYLCVYGRRWKCHFVNGVRDSHTPSHWDHRRLLKNLFDTIIFSEKTGVVGSIYAKAAHCRYRVSCPIYFH